MICSIDGCDKPVRARGLCGAHYKRLWRYGSADVTKPHANASKTHCKRGHEYTPDNTYLTNCGRRMCRECKRLRQREIRRQMRQADRAWHAANGTTHYRHCAD